MANILLRAIKKSLPIGIKFEENILRQYASFTAREIFSENSRQTGTLFLRFAKHLAIENRKSMDILPTTIRYADYFPINNLKQFDNELQRTTADQLPALIIFAYTYRPSANPPDFATVLNKIDAAAMKLLPEMSDEVILHTLYSMLFLMPSWINLMDFYRASVQRLAQDYLAGRYELTKDKFVQLCFYLGLDKRNALSSSQMFKKILAQQLPVYLSQLTVTDLGIVCNASYKAAIIVKDEQFDKILMQEILGLESSPDNKQQIELLITFIKTLRLQRCKNAQICEHLTNLVANSQMLKQLPVSGLTHLFAVFAENSWNNELSTRPIIDAFLSNLGDIEPPSTISSNQNNKFRQTSTSNIRAKDIDKFLWCCAHLNCDLPKGSLKQIEEILLQKLNNGEFNSFPDQLVDSSLSLWMMGHKSRKLYQQAEYLKSQHSPKRHQPKVDSRLTVLRTAVAIEEPTWLEKSAGTDLQSFNLENEAPEYLYKNRLDLVELAQRIADEEGIKQTQIISPLLGINIASILVEFENQANDQIMLVELLSKQQMLQFSAEPVGLLKLKLHLLQTVGQKVIVLRSEELEKYTCLKDLMDAVVVPEVKNKQTVRNV